MKYHLSIKNRYSKLSFRRNEKAKTKYFLLGLWEMAGFIKNAEDRAFLKKAIREHMYAVEKNSSR